MSAPRRWSETPADEVERDVARVAGLPPRALRLDAWDEVMARAATRPRPLGSYALLFACSCAVGLALAWALIPREHVQPAPVVLTAQDTRWSAASPQEVELHEGRLWMTTPSEQRLLVRTPHATLEISRCAFLAEVTKNDTFLRVDEGEVVVRSRDGVRRVGKGESLVAGASVEIPSELLERLPADDSRCEGDGDARRACLRREASGASLSAEVALFELGSFEADARRAEEAVRAWREALARFPEGVIHPEVRIALLVALVKERRFEEARAVAEEFERRCAGDPRIGEVRALVRSLP